MSGVADYRGLRDALRSFIPWWLSDRLGFRTGYMILYAMALLCDIAITWCVQAVYSWFPGYSLGLPVGAQGLDPSTALPLIGRSRSILRGEADTDASFASFLIGWLDYAEAAGSSEILATMIRHYLGNSPTVRIVDRAGFWVMIDGPTGVITTATSAWNWDGTSNPERAGWWSDLWVIVYADEWTRYASFTDAAWLAAFGGVSGNGIGHEVGRAAVDAITSIVEQWKGAHCWLVAVLFTSDSGTLSPGGVNPDGNWGNWSKTVSGVTTPARVLPSPHQAAVRTWIPTGG
jgi:hypothetical protein